MRIQVLAAAVAVATLVTGSSVQAQSNYYAALAIDHNAGDAYGWAVNQCVRHRTHRDAMQLLHIVLCPDLCTQ